MYKERWQGETESSGPRAVMPRAKEAPDNDDDATACLAIYEDGIKTPICGELSFDSTDDGMVCIEVDGKWRCE